MGKLQAGSKLESVSASLRTLVLKPKVLPSPTPKAPLPSLQQRLGDRLKRLEWQAQRINQLSAELEGAMHELKAIAAEVNQDMRSMQAARNPFGFGRSLEPVLETCEYWATTVPQVTQKPNGALLLTTKPVDLLKDERQAMSTAVELRQRAKRKRSQR